MTNRKSMILQAKLRHSDAVIAQGATSDDAIFAENVVAAIINSPPNKVADIIAGALSGFVLHLANGHGMRVGGDNPTRGLSAALAVFMDDFDAQPHGTVRHADKAWADWHGVVPEEIDESLDEYDGALGPDISPEINETNHDEDLPSSVDYEDDAFGEPN